MKRLLRLTPSAAIFSSALTGLLLSIAGCSDPGTAGSTGGAPAVGGASGGAASTTGGAASGGAASGGAASGGAASGGAASGGAASGGAASGGGASGGAASGGTATGGGEATGGAATGGGSSSGEFTLTSTDWAVDGAPIDRKHTCDGGGGVMSWGVAPQLTWENPPEGTMSYAIFMIDWTLTMGSSPSVLGYHSAGWNIPTTITELDSEWVSGTDLPGATAINGVYLGPCPPSGTDTYHIIVMALPMASYTISGSASAGVQTAYNMLKDVALATAEITGTYMQE